MTFRILLLILVLCGCGRSENQFKEISYTFSEYYSDREHNCYVIRPEKNEIEFARVYWRYKKSYDPDSQNISWPDTTFSETYAISNGELRSYLDSINSNKLDSCFHPKGGLGTHGYCFRIQSIAKQNDTTSVTCDHEPFKNIQAWLNALFKLSKGIKKDYESQCLDEDNRVRCIKEQSFEKVGNNPAEYRFWGPWSPEDSLPLVQSLQDIPKDKPIIFDLRNGDVFNYYEIDSVLGRRGHIYGLINRNDVFGYSRYEHANIRLDSMEILYGDRLQDSIWLSAHQYIKNEYQDYRRTIYYYNRRIARNRRSESFHYTSRDELMKALRSTH